MKIYKYDVPFGAISAHRIYENPQFVLAGIQDEIPRIWAKVSGGERMIRKFTVVGTGHEFPDGWEHIGSFQHGSFVWHIMEVPPDA